MKNFTAKKSQILAQCDCQMTDLKRHAVTEVFYMGDIIITFPTITKLTLAHKHIGKRKWKRKGGKKGTLN